MMKFREVLTYIEKDYVDAVDSEDLVETAINTMLEKLDPHSVYIPAKDLKLANSQLEGEFDGIGIEFSLIRDTIHVIAPLSGGPSEKVGLLSGDKIIKVDDKTVAGVGITNREVFDKLRGPKGTEVQLGIKRKGTNELKNFTIIREKIPQNSIDVSYMIDHEVGYIKVSRFSATTYEEFKTALTTLKGVGLKKLVIDLQGNPGGYLGAAFNMADELISENKMIVYTDGKDSQYDSEYRARKKGLFEKGSVVILIDEGSASASEIVAGAIQDNDRGIIVGRRSFGKGLVQMPIDLSDGSELRLTISRYYTPSGRSIQKPYKNGADPDYKTDLLNRFEHGELFNADSIKFNDSLKFETGKGRIVYGGGGIMPDYFVPIDTSMNTEYFRNLFENNVVKEYTINYVQKNQKQLESTKLEDFLKNFEVTSAMMKDFTALASSSGVVYNEKQYETSSELIKLNIKANIAKSQWNNEGFYKVYNETNEILKEGLGLFDQAEELAQVIK